MLLYSKPTPNLPLLLSLPSLSQDAKKQFLVQGVYLDNLDLSIPTDKNRAERSKFMKATEMLDSAVDSDNGKVVMGECGKGKEELMDALQTVQVREGEGEERRKENLRTNELSHRCRVSLSLFTLVHRCRSSAVPPTPAPKSTVPSSSPTP